MIISLIIDAVLPLGADLNRFVQICSYSAAHGKGSSIPAVGGEREQKRANKKKSKDQTSFALLPLSSGTKVARKGSPRSKTDGEECRRKNNRRRKRKGRR